jgi:hypothetical protein
MTALEVKKYHGEGEERQFGWLGIAANKALLPCGETFRCPECHGRVITHKASESQEAHGEHPVRHKG